MQTPTVEELAAAVQAERHGSRWLARCLFADQHTNGDAHPSMAVFQGQAGNALLVCAPCKANGRGTRELMQEAERRGLLPIVRSRIGKNGRTIEATYDYKDEAGASLYQVVRYKPKGFSQRRPDGRGGWNWNLEGVRRVLYGLPALLDGVGHGTQVLIVEGEKDADALAGLGYVATTCAQGAGKWRPEYGECLRGARVCILPDNDDAGRGHAHQVAAALQAVAAEIRILELPGLAAKGDASDWLAAGGNVDQLDHLLAEAPERAPRDSALAAPSKPKKSDFTRSVLTMSELAALEIPEPKLLAPWLPDGGLAMVYGQRGVGKTWFALGLGVALARGRPFLNWPLDGPVGVLIVDGEMRLAEQRKRLHDLGAMETQDRISLLSHETYYRETGRDLDLTSDDSRDALLTLLDQLPKTRVVVLDNLSCLFPGLRENERDDWATAGQPFLLACRRRGVACIMLHHANKGGEPRGTSSREDALDAVIRLEPLAEDSGASSGARFKVVFTKSRGAFGETVATRQVEVAQGADGWIELAASSVGAAVKDRVLALIINEGELTVTEAAELLGVTKGAVSKAKTALQAEGLLARGQKLMLSQPAATD